MIQAEEGPSLTEEIVHRGVGDKFTGCISARGRAIASQLSRDPGATNHHQYNSITREGLSYDPSYTELAIRSVPPLSQVYAD